MSIRENKFIFISLLLIIVISFCYYAWLGAKLPALAGPDEYASEQASIFYKTHQRLAVYPEDQDLVSWSDTGNHRTLRSPFGFIMGAVSATLFDGAVNQFRVANAFTMSLALALLFITCLVFTGHRVLSLFTTFIIGTLPQFAFVASYLNGDSGAILSGSLFFLFLAVLARHGLTNTAFLLATACLGLTIINKQTAYAAVVVLFLLFIANLFNVFKKPLKIWALGIGLFVLFGGWWVIRNVLVYGWDDPIQVKIRATMVELTAKTPDLLSGSREKFGMGYIDIMLDPLYWYGLFLSFTGYFGKLQLRMYGLHYVFFGVFVVSSLLAFFWMLFKDTAQLFRRKITLNQAFFIWAFIFLAINYFLYLLFIVTVDVQLQGKYLMPSLGALAVALCCLMVRLNQRIAGFHYFMLLVIVTTVFFHYEIIRHIARPFYYPDRYLTRYVTVSENPLSVNVSEMHDIVVDKNANMLVLRSESNDPQIIWGKAMCLKLGENFRLTAEFEASQSGAGQIYVDDGIGYREGFSKKIAFNAGLNHLIFDITLGNHGCESVRFDPMDFKGQLRFKTLTLQRLAIAVAK